LILLGGNSTFILLFCTINYRLFGGAEGYSKLMDTCVDPSCSKEVISLVNFSYSVVIAFLLTFLSFLYFLICAAKRMSV
jgi:hypothetical protein